MKKNVIVACIIVAVVGALYLIALNGRYKPFANGFLILDNWTGKVYPVEDVTVKTDK